MKPNTPTILDQLRQWWRDKRRGYTAKDAAGVALKFRHAKPGDCIRVTAAEFRAHIAMTQQMDLRVRMLDALGEEGEPYVLTPLSDFTTTQP